MTDDPQPDRPAPALRDRIADALADAEGWQWAPGFDKSQSPTYQHYLRQADAVVAALPAPADRAAEWRAAAEHLEQRAAVIADNSDDPAIFVAKARERDAAGWKDAAAELRHMADCSWCDAGIEHTVHCPTPETHNWGCGCPTDPVPADGPSRMADEAQQPETQADGAQFGSPDCTCIPFVWEGGTARYCQPGDTVDQISGWERGGDCPHHRPTA